MDTRQRQLSTWLNAVYSQPIELSVVDGDASFRRYFRFSVAGKSYVAMDAPPDLEDTRPFVVIARAFLKHGIPVPEIYHEDLAQGFLVLSDFGDEIFHHHLNIENVDHLYGVAAKELIKIQQITEVENFPLPLFDYEAMHEELCHNTEWFLEKYLQLDLSDNELNMLESTYDVLLKSATSQPQLTTHRDYHSRNLMLLDDGRVGVIDFQDAVIGPITYDLVSMLRDCYIDWPVEKVHAWVLAFRQKLLLDNLLDSRVSETEFMRWFDLMGMQRHWKAIFIFARKCLRDQHHFYLQFIPRALNYVACVAAKYPELKAFNTFLEDEVLLTFQEIYKQ